MVFALILLVRYALPFAQQPAMIDRVFGYSQITNSAPQMFLPDFESIISEVQAKKPTTGNGWVAVDESEMYQPVDDFVDTDNDRGGYAYVGNY